MVRFGIIGTNTITDKLLEAAASVEGFALTAVYSRTLERANAYADRYDIKNRYDDLESFASCSEMDAVYIASPNALHESHAVLCMSRGKHVLCEKPLASNSREAQRMVDASKSYGVTLMEAVKSTLLPNFAAIREHLPKLGTIRRYSATYGQYSSRYDAYRQGTVLNAFNPDLSNGALLDLGIYCLYPLVVLFGSPQRVQANAVMLQSGVDGSGSMLLTYPGMEAHVAYSKIATSYTPSEIQGEDATMLIHKISQPNKVEIRYRDGTVQDITVPQVEANMRYELEAFIHLIREGHRESGINTHQVSLEVFAIMDEARRQIGLRYPADA